jgi:hypothetical protein
MDFKMQNLHQQTLAILVNQAGRHTGAYLHTLTSREPTPMEEPPPPNTHHLHRGHWSTERQILLWTRSLRKQLVF